jgi:hypothetical protein
VVLNFYHVRTKTEAVNKALIDWLKNFKKIFIELRGKVEFEDNVLELKMKEIEYSNYDFSILFRFGYL